MSKIAKQLLTLFAGIVVLALILGVLYLIGYQPSDFIYQDF